MAPHEPVYLIVVPTYNEADNIAPLIAGIRANAPAAHVLFVDDNSADQTRARIADAMRETPDRVFLLPRAGKLGLGTAYVEGFRWAMAREYAGVIEMDADLSHRPVDLKPLLHRLRSAPVVVGSRYIPGGGTVNWNWFRKLISRAGSLYARTVLGVPVQDLTGGFNGWQREVIAAIGIDTVRSEGYSFQIELKYRAMLAGYDIAEMPIIFEERRAGQSKMSGAIVFEAMARVWQLAARRPAIKAEMAEPSRC
jgi:dolichol-phosphate mannosyltransferase